jgi:hypothetical protein
MTTHEKATTFTLVGATLLIITVILRHATDNLTAHRWADDYLPFLAFVLIANGIRYNLRARKEAAGSAPRTP